MLESSRNSRPGQGCKRCVGKVPAEFAPAHLFHHPPFPDTCRSKADVGGVKGRRSAGRAAPFTHPEQLDNRAAGKRPNPIKMIGFYQSDAPSLLIRPDLVPGVSRHPRHRPVRRCGHRQSHRPSDFGLRRQSLPQGIGRQQMSRSLRDLLDVRELLQQRNQPLRRRLTFPGLGRRHDPPRRPDQQIGTFFNPFSQFRRGLFLCHFVSPLKCETSVLRV